MNIFEKDAHERSVEQTGSGILSAWVCFAAAIEDLVKSYNRHPKGQRFPAGLKKQTDTNVVIECAMGQSADDSYAQLMVTVRADLGERAPVIECSIQRWLRRMGGRIAPEVSSESKMRFTLDTDNSSLCWNQEKLAPYEAAEKLLGRALL